MTRKRKATQDRTEMKETCFPQFYHLFKPLDYFCLFMALYILTCILLSLLSPSTAFNSVAFIGVLLILGLSFLPKVALPWNFKTSVRTTIVQESNENKQAERQRERQRQGLKLQFKEETEQLKEEIERIEQKLQAMLKTTLSRYQELISYDEFLKIETLKLRSKFILTSSGSCLRTVFLTISTYHASFLRSKLEQIELKPEYTETATNARVYLIPITEGDIL